MTTLAGVLREPAVAVARLPRRPARPIAPGPEATPARRVQGAASVVAGSASLQDPAVAAVVGVVALSQAPDVAQAAGITIVVVASATAMSRAPSDGPSPDPRERSRLRW